MRLSISEILEKSQEFKTRKEKVAWLKANDTPALRTVIKYAWDDNIKFLLPKGSAPYKPMPTNEGHGMLYHEARKLYLFVEGGNPNLKQLRREQLFIQLLESIDPKDAELIINVKDKKLPYKGLDRNLIKEAFKDLL